MHPHVALSALSRSYGARTVLDSVDLAVKPGEFITLIGPSGCGKSTLLKLIAGLIAPSAGCVSIDGYSPLEARKSMSFIFQDATLLPWRTVEQNVGLQLELGHVAKAVRRERVAALLKLVGLTDAAHCYPRQLSGGMKMRVSIARALSNEPRLLLMDEPFAALDEISRERLNEEILRLKAEQQWTSIFVTHSVAEAVFLSTRILVLSAHPGRIAHQVEVDLPVPRTAEIRTQPAFETLVGHVSRTLRAITLAERGYRPAALGVIAQEAQAS